MEKEFKHMRDYWKAHKKKEFNLSEKIYPLNDRETKKQLMWGWALKVSDIKEFIKRQTRKLNKKLKGFADEQKEWWIYNELKEFIKEFKKEAGDKLIERRRKWKKQLKNK